MLVQYYQLSVLQRSLELLFQGEPYDDEDFRAQVGFVMESIEKYNPKVYGFSYDPDGYRFQYEPQGYRGYIEGRVIKR